MFCARFSVGLFLLLPFLIRLCVVPESSWCHALRTKKKLAGVCWDWYRVGLEILYEEVIIRRIGQISALLRTLETGPYFGTIIKSLEVNCFVPKAYFSLFRENIGKIVKHCPLLHKIAFVPQVYLLEHPVPFPISFLGISRTITHLKCDPSFDFNSVAPGLVHLSQTLISLSVTFSSQETTPSDTKALLSHLRYLEIRCDRPSSIDILHQVLIVPALTHFTLACTNCRGSRLSDFSSILQFCASRGSNLRRLQLNCICTDVRDRSAVTDIFQEIFNGCPFLEHFVQFAKCSAYLLSLSHPTIRWIDEWDDIDVPGRYLLPDPQSHESNPFTSVSSLESVDTPTEPIHRLVSCYPNVQGLRRFHASLRGQLQLPILLPPSTRSNFEFNYPGLFIKYWNGSFYRMDGWLDADDLSDEENSKSSGSSTSSDSNSEGMYHPSDEEGKDDDSGSSCSDDSSDRSGATDIEAGLTDEFYDGEDWEADNDTALSVFADTTES